MHAYTQRVALPCLQQNSRNVTAVPTLDIRSIVKHQVQSKSKAQISGKELCRCSVSQNDSTDYVRQLEACEADGDWLKAVELLAAVRALKLDMPGEAFEAAVRLCAQSGQWQKAVSILEQAHAQGSVSDPTTVAVFTTLLRESQPAAALRLLKDMEQRGADNWEARGQCHNMVARTCARGGMLDEGLELLDNMYKAELHIQRDTYEALALGCLRAGRGERAEQLFEERDYM